MSKPDGAETCGAMLIRGGTVIDGSGAPGHTADVRIRGGFIEEIGEALAPRPAEALFAAAGCLVTPGFIDHHTHYDGTVFWADDLDPSAGYGITTVIMGNCGFGIAPLSSPGAHGDAVDIMS